MIAPIRPATSPSPETLHRQFVDHILPAVKLHASMQFRHLKGQDRDNAIQESMAVAWQIYVQAVGSNKDPASFPIYIAAFAVKRVRSGRLLAGKNSRDVLAPVTQQRNGFDVRSLDDESCDSDTGWKAAVAQDTKNFTPADAVAFRLDFDRWVNSLKQRDREIGERLAVGDRPGQVARKFKLSPSGVSKTRRRMQRRWEQFQNAGPAGLRAAKVPA